MKKMSKGRGRDQLHQSAGKGHDGIIQRADGWAVGSEHGFGYRVFFWGGENVLKLDRDVVAQRCVY